VLERVKGIEPSSLAWEAPDFRGFPTVSEQNKAFLIVLVSIGYQLKAKQFKLLALTLRQNFR